MATYDGMEFPEKLKALMQAHRYSQGDVAKCVDVSQSLVSLWTRGERVPDLPTAAKLAKLLGVDLDFLADDAQDEPAPDFGEWERSVIELIRALNLDRKEVWSRLAGPGESQTAPPKVLAGQAALDLIATTEPIPGPPVVHQDPEPTKSGPARRKA